MGSQSWTEYLQTYRNKYIIIRMKDFIFAGRNDYRIFLGKFLIVIIRSPRIGVISVF